MHGKSVWCAVVRVGILSDGSVESGSASVSACGNAWKARGGTMLVTLGRPSFALVMRAMATGTNLKCEALGTNINLKHLTQLL